MLIFDFSVNFPTNQKHLADLTNISCHYSEKGYLPKHAHSYWEFILVSKGSIINYINNTEIKIEKSSVCLIRPTDCHYITPGNKENGYFNYAIKNKLMKNQLELIEPGLYNSLIKGKEIFYKIPEYSSEEIVKHLNSIIMFVDDNEKKVEKIKKLVFIKLLDTLQEHLLNTYSNEPLWLIQINKLLSSPQNLFMNVNNISETIFFSRTHLNRLFQKHLNISTKEYLLNYKFAYVCRALISTSQSITSISHTIGYSSITVFNNHFKKRYGTTPGVYRKTNKASMHNYI